MSVPEFIYLLSCQTATCFHKSINNETVYTFCVKRKHFEFSNKKGIVLGQIICILAR